MLGRPGVIRPSPVPVVGAWTGIWGKTAIVARLAVPFAALLGRQNRENVCAVVDLLINFVVFGKRDLPPGGRDEA